MISGIPFAFIYLYELSSVAWGSLFQIMSDSLMGNLSKVLAVLSACCAAWTSTTTAAAFELGDEKQTPLTAGRVDLATDSAGNVHVVSLGPNVIEYARLTNGNFSAVVQVGGSLGNIGPHWDWRPHVAADSHGYPHVVWTTPPPAAKVAYSKFDGAEWKYQILWAGWSELPDIDIDSKDVVHVAFHDISAYDIQYARITPGNPPEFVKLHNTPYYPFEPDNPRIYVDSLDRVHVVWRNGWPPCTTGYRMFDGTNWSAQQEPFCKLGALTGSETVAVDTKGITHIAITKWSQKHKWHDVAVTTNDGDHCGTWSEPVIVEPREGTTGLNSVALETNDSGATLMAYAVNTELVAGQWQHPRVRFSIRERNETSWSAPLDITDHPGQQVHPAIAALGDTFWVCWEDSRKAVYCRTVSSPAPTCQLEATPNPIRPHQHTLLTWSAEHANQCSLQFDDAVGPVPCNGAHEFVPQQHAIAEGDHPIVFSVQGPAGSETCQVLMTVQAPMGNPVDDPEPVDGTIARQPIANLEPRKLPSATTGNSGCPTRSHSSPNRVDCWWLLLIIGLALFSRGYAYSFRT